MHVFGFSPSAGSMRAAALCVLIPASALIAREPGLDAINARVAARDVRVTWRLPLPLGYTTRLDACRLADGILYAIGRDGRVRAVDAATGIFLWSAEIGPGHETIWGPVPYYTSNPQVPVRAVVFNNFSHALLLDALTGRILRRAALPAPPVAAVAAHDELLFTPAVGKRVYCTSFHDDGLNWQVGTRGPVRLSPLYIPEIDLLYVVGDGGLVQACNSEREWLFSEELHAAPHGWMASDASAIYISTGGHLPAIHALDRMTGEPVRQPYRLSGRPEGGPVVTRTAVYQAVADGGLHCVGLTPETRAWFNPDARMFLAEWPGRVVVLRRDGQIGFVDTATRRSLPPLDLGVRFKHGVINTANDAAFAVTEEGVVWCLRPVGAGPIDASTFGIPTSRPASRPAQEPVAAEPEAAGALAPAAAVPPRPAPPSNLGLPTPPPAPAPPAEAGAPQPPPPPEGGGVSQQILNQLEQALQGRPNQ